MDVDAIISEERAKVAKLTALVNIEQPEEVTIDEGNLLAFDSRPVESRKINSEHLRDLTRDNAQLLFNAIWQLPTKKDDDGVYAMLPAPTTRIPREKPIPKEKPKTRWEKFAEVKGIAKRKKERMVYDEEAKEYRPVWGYKKARDDRDVPIIELSEQADPYEDQFEKRRKEKKERVAKNEEQRLRNVAAARLSHSGVKVNREVIRKELRKSMVVGRKATASAGVFDESLKGEPKVRVGASKAKRTSVAGDYEKEKSKSLEVLRKVTRGAVSISTDTGFKSADAEESQKTKGKKAVGKGGKKAAPQGETKMRKWNAGAKGKGRK